MTKSELIQRLAEMYPDPRLYHRDFERVVNKVFDEISNALARGDREPTVIKLKIQGVRKLTLEVDFGKEQDVGDRVIWADARLLRDRVSPG